MHIVNPLMLTRLCLPLSPLALLVCLFVVRFYFMTVPDLWLHRRIFDLMVKNDHIDFSSYCYISPCYHFLGYYEQRTANVQIRQRRFNQDGY